MALSASHTATPPSMIPRSMGRRANCLMRCLLTAFWLLDYVQSLSSIPATIAGHAVRPVRVPLRPNLAVTVFDASDHQWWASQGTADLATGQTVANVYGLKLWPGALAVAESLTSLAAARESSSLAGLTVLELGCGNGLASLTAAALGAEEVTATDISESALLFTRSASTFGGLDDRLSTRHFDVLGCDRAGAVPLPSADIVLVADLLYEPALARGVAQRVAEGEARGSCVIIAGDPDRHARADFLEAYSRIVGVKEQRFFEPGFSVRLDALKWKSKRVEVAVLNQGAFVVSDDETCPMSARSMEMAL